MSVAFIGGTGLYRLAGLELEPRRVDTRYGAVTVSVGAVGQVEVVFLARHGGGHETPPHAVNYRANIAALKALGVTRVIASSAVGTLSADLPPGSLALLTDFIDHTSGRPRTFFEDAVVHLDYTSPYCPQLRAGLARAAQAAEVALLPSAVYVCTNGPRFETPAEIRMFRQWGAEVVGMTSVPEVVLAREAELCYAAVAIATNDAAGVTGHTLTHGEVEEMMAARVRDLARLFETYLASDSAADCPCRHALDEYRQRTGRADFGILPAD